MTDITLPDPYLPSEGEKMYAQHLGITPRLAKKLINTGRLNGVRLGRTYLVTEGDFIRSMQDGVRPERTVTSMTQPQPIHRTKRSA